MEELVRYRDLVFPSRAGTPLDQGNVNRQQFKKLLRNAGLLPMRPYDIPASRLPLLRARGPA